MINIVVFSKDRACQLELFLRSMKNFFFEWGLCKVSILYTYSNDKFKKGYEKTRFYHPEFNYVLEDGRGFKTQLLELINEKHKATMFFVDDIVFKDTFLLRTDEMKLFMYRNDIACLSLRMCPRINYCYTEKRDTPPPPIAEDGTWNWVGLPGDWGYPNSVDGHIYKTNEILPLMRSMDYWNPNTFEGSWANRQPFDRPYMICYKESKIVNNPINKVQTANGNHCGNISAETINNEYLDNQHISLITFIGIKNTSAHQILPMIFVKNTRYSLAEMCTAVDDNLIDYNKVLNSSMFVERTEPADINVYIPIKGRANFIDPCINHLKKAIQQGSYKVKIVIIENDNIPANSHKVEALGLDYIFIPLSVCQSDGVFAKALSYNVAYILSKSAKWNIFHDLDILVESQYFSKLKTYLDKDPRWVQPYTERRVLRLSEESTNELCTGKILDVESIPEKEIVPSRPGSPGGSIVIRFDVFEEIGGFDPELFSGYAPEDDFIWTKLEVSTNKIDVVYGCFAGGGVFADDPSIEVYHLFHDSVLHENKKYQQMLDYRTSFYELHYSEKIEFVNKKQDIFKGAFK